MNIYCVNRGVIHLYHLSRSKNSERIFEYFLLHNNLTVTAKDFNLTQNIQFLSKFCQEMIKEMNILKQYGARKMKHY